MKKLMTTLILAIVSAGSAQAQNDSIQGTYKALLTHEAAAGGNAFHQFATLTLKSVNTGGNLKISGTVKMIFGDWNSNEFLTYEFPEVPMNILTRQVSLTSEQNDVSFVGVLKQGELKGEWYNTSVGKVGSFVASKTRVPAPDTSSQLVKTITGHYKGLLQNTHPESNLPERMTMSLVTTQGVSEEGIQRLVISGNLRFYLGDFGGNEYVESKLSDVKFNYYTRYLTVKTQEYGITLKGTLEQSGIFNAEVFADGLGAVGRVELRVIQ